jgi:hypothetical protein
MSEAEPPDVIGFDDRCFEDFVAGSSAGCSRRRNC